MKLISNFLPSPRAIFSRVATEGLPLPFSSRQRLDAFIPQRSASSCCVSPSSILASTICRITSRSADCPSHSWANPSSWRDLSRCFLKSLISRPPVLAHPLRPLDLPRGGLLRLLDEVVREHDLVSGDEEVEDPRDVASLHGPQFEYPVVEVPGERHPERVPVLLQEF